MIRLNPSICFLMLVTCSTPATALAQSDVKYVSRGNAVSPDAAAAPASTPETFDVQNLYLQGIARPKMDAELRPSTQGTVLAVHVREGQWVKQGTPLITLDDRIARATVSVAEAAAQARGALKQAKLAMQEAQSIMSRTQMALQVKASSEFEMAAKTSQYEQAIAAYEQQVELAKSAAAELKLAEAQRELLTLRAPFDGEVLKIGVKLGNTVDPTEVAVRVADMKRLSVEMHLPLAMFGTITPGQNYVFRAGAPVQRIVEARAEFISRVVEPTSGTFRARFQIDNSDQGLPAGFEIWFQDAE